ncbi:MAG: DUF2933 domain-containing protein [Actinomycetota bacterium]
MRDVLRMCLNWKVLAGLAAVGVGVWALAPDLASSALPLLLVLACPLSMFLMMRGMHTGEETTRERHVSRSPGTGSGADGLRKRLAAVEDEEKALLREIAQRETAGTGSDEGRESRELVQIPHESRAVPEGNQRQGS